MYSFFSITPNTTVKKCIYKNVYNFFLFQEFEFMYVITVRLDYASD